MLAVAGTMPTDTARYAFEFKWDGVRAMVYVSKGKLVLRSRNQNDMTASYPELWPLAKAMGRRQVLLDGEVIAVDDAGRPSFARLQRRMHVKDPDHQLLQRVPVSLVLFDVLRVDGHSVMGLPYERRRALLEELAPDGPTWDLTPQRRGQGEAMLAAARRNQLEGLVAKRLTSVYEPGRRSGAWIKIKLRLRQELVIGGWIEESSGRLNRIGALLMGYYQGRALRYAGRVGSGLAGGDHATLLGEFAPLERAESAFAESINFRSGRFSTAPRGTVHYLAPKLVAEVEYGRWPDGGLIQHGVYQGLRSDKAARSVVKECHGGLTERKAFNEQAKNPRVAAGLERRN
jgi:bifunctional non-homologous end joining protein LigD